MSKRYGTTTQVSLDFPEEGFSGLFRMIEQQIKHETSQKGLKVIGRFHHEKNRVASFSQETGEPLVFFAIWSSVEIEDTFSRD